MAARSVKSLLLFLVLSGSAYATDLTAVPNDLRDQVKSVKKFDEITLLFHGESVNARVSPFHKKPVLLYGVRSVYQPKDLNAWLVQEYLNSQYELKPVASLPAAEMYDLYYLAKPVHGAFIQWARSSDGTWAALVRFPHEGADPLKFQKLPEGQQELALVGERLMETVRIADAKGEWLLYPEKSGLFRKKVLTAQATLSTAGTLEKIVLPNALSFPDQIRVAPTGLVWFSLPSHNKVANYDPKTKTFDFVNVGNAPDGVGIDQSGRVWFGEYSDAAIGRIDPSKSNEYKRFPTPTSNPAIPYEERTRKFLYTTDHAHNVILKFDLSTEKFTQIPVSSPGAWPVDLFQAEDDGSVWVSLVSANKLGRAFLADDKFEEVPLGTSAQPAFCAPVASWIYCSLWSGTGLIGYQPSTGEQVEVTIPDLHGVGPVSSDSKGRVVFGTLSAGRVYVYDPVTNQAEYVQGVGMMKDGVAVAPDDAVWATETSSAIYRIKF